MARLEGGLGTFPIFEARKKEGVGTPVKLIFLHAP